MPATMRGAKQWAAQRFWLGLFVAGLLVAIPALLGYNYLVSRMKTVSSDMQIFIDEFVTKMAEFYCYAEVETTH